MVPRRYREYINIVSRTDCKVDLAIGSGTTVLVLCTNKTAADASALGTQSWLDSDAARELWETSERVIGNVLAI